MTIAMQAEGPIATLRASGRLSSDDYRQVLPEIESMMKRFGRIRMLVELVDLRGWTPGGLWEDLKFDARHFSDVERLAIIGENTWHEAVTRLFKPFTRAEVKYFSTDQSKQARTWIREGLDETGPRQQVA